MGGQRSNGQTMNSVDAGFMHSIRSIKAIKLEATEANIAFKKKITKTIIKLYK